MSNMQEWSEKQLDDQLKEGQRAFIFFHTPFCGTCQLAKKMLTVAEAMLPDVTIGMSNLNYMPSKAEVFSIESVPCLIEVKNGSMVKKLYAFHSIEHVLEELR
jgi:thioredoxin-like negative regulator of GroEL